MPDPAPGRAAGSTPFLPWLLAITALSLLVNLLYSRYLFADSYYDLYAGRYILRHGIPHRNVVTVTGHGAAWIDQQWLAHAVYYAAWAAGGYPALALLCALLVTSGFTVLALTMHGRGVPATRVFLWTAAAIIPYLGNIVIRAQSFAFPLFAVTLWLVLADSRAPRLRVRTWLVIPVLVVWANTHGSVLIGAALVALYAGCRAVRALRAGDYPPVPACLGLGAAAVASVICTPYGPSVLSYYRRVNAVAPALSHYVTEWQRPSPLYFVSMGFFAVLAAVVIALVIAWRRGARTDPLLAAIAVGLLALALTAIRNQTFFGLAGCLLAADTLARGGARRAPPVSAVFTRAVAAGLAAAALTGAAVIAAEPGRRFESLVPVRAIGAAAALAARDPAARVLADEWSGPPLLWLHPGVLGRAGFDARLEQFSPAQLAGYAEFLTARARGWQRLLRGYDLVLVSRGHHLGLARAVARLPGWRIVYSGRDGLVLARGPAGARTTVLPTRWCAGHVGRAAPVSTRR